MISVFDVAQVRRNIREKNKIDVSLLIYIKTYGSESRGQEAKRIAKNKTCDELLCATRTKVFVIWRRNHSQHLSTSVNFYTRILDTQSSFQH